MSPMRMQNVVDSGWICRNGLPREIPFEDLCPPVVYVYDSSRAKDYANFVSGFVGPEKRALQNLEREFEKKSNGNCMSEAEIRKFLGSELPEISHARVSSILIRLREECTRVVEVRLKEDEIEDYFKALTSQRGDRVYYATERMLRAGGLDPKVSSMLGRYDELRAKPFLDNPEATNYMFYNRLRELERILPRNLAYKCVECGLFADDIKKQGMTELETRSLVHHFGGRWRERLNEFKKLTSDVGIGYRHPKLMNSTKNTRANLKICKERGVNPKDEELLVALRLPQEEFIGILDGKQKAKKG